MANERVRVKRDGPRGWHNIDKEKYDANPGAYELVDDGGDSGASDDGASVVVATKWSTKSVGRGWYSIFDAEGNEIVSGLTRSEASTFDKLDNAGQAAEVQRRIDASGAVKPNE